MSVVVETVTKDATAEVNQLADRSVDTVDTNARYVAYGARLRTALRASTRYIAYGDVGYETYKAQRQGPSPIEAANFSEPTRLTMIATKRAVFQSVASMQAAKAFVNVKNLRLKEHATDRVFDWVSEQMIKENARKAKKEL
ncbi:hypothetical protein FRC10_000646 [Ceratobasidium sp. 414]|nr:hypothetical protein FRC10_000646 [Ceratobasidium sp. 414]